MISKQASLQEADSFDDGTAEKLREVEALWRQFKREREQWCDDELERLHRELRSEVELRDRQIEEIQMEKVRVEERVREYC